MSFGSDERFWVGSRNFSAEPWVSKGRRPWSEKEKKAGRRSRWGPGLFVFSEGIQGVPPGEVGSGATILKRSFQNCPTELRQFLVTPSGCEDTNIFRNCKRGGKNWLGTPSRSQNLQAVYRLKIVSWKESCARMPGPKSLWIEGTV